MANQSIINKLVDEKRVGKTSDDTWVVVSNATYQVSRQTGKFADGFFCERLDSEKDVGSKSVCPGWKYCTGARVDKTCKHVEAVKAFEVKAKQ
jgi:hypothetical protein